MPDLANPQSRQNRGRSNKRLIILGAVLVCAFIAWVVTMVTSSNLGFRP